MAISQSCIGKASGDVGSKSMESIFPVISKVCPACHNSFRTPSGGPHEKKFCCVKCRSKSCNAHRRAELKALGIVSTGRKAVRTITKAELKRQMSHILVERICTCCEEVFLTRDRGINT